jgi:DNA modification methylase
MGSQDTPADTSNGAVSRPRKLTPKRPQSEKAGLADVFPYYAGFSFNWATKQLHLEADRDRSVVLDPWNGSGTTTLAARANGIRSIGIDLNPIANVVAQLRTQVGHDVQPCPPPLVSRASVSTTDPLLSWFSRRTASRLRHWSLHFDTLPEAESTLGYIAVFRVVRSLTSRFEGSNPTWVRRTSSNDDLIDIGRKHLDELIIQDQKDVRERLTAESYTVAPVSIVRASSKQLPLADKSVNFILTSPPYLTRIDYAVAYSRELAVFGVDTVRDRSLRAALMGTTLIRPDRKDLKVYGPIARDLVTSIGAHGSKASSGYYLKQAKQYLDDLTDSFEEIARVSKQHAVMKLVVQDSYYKDIPIRLAEICVEEAGRRGWMFVEWDRAEVTRNLTQVNTAARAYPKGRVDETVITLRKAR